MPDYLSPEGDERQEVSDVQPSALAILNQSEHSAMVVTANLPSNRRKLADFDSKLMAYANHSQPVALSMFYSLPRAGKQIIGPSVRYAEIVAPCWKNNAVASRVIGDASNTVTAQGIFLDYEANIRNSIEVPRRITDKNGNRFSDDMIITTSNAAMSVARRNAVLKGGVPQALWTPPYEAAQLTAVGKAASHAQRVADAMEFLHKMGLTEWQILNAVGVPSPRELETEHLVTLRVLCQEIKRGDKTIEQVFGSEHDKEIDSLFVQLKMNQAQQTMLRNSYLGRAQELVIYLRERLGSATGMAGEPVNRKPFTVEETVAQKSTPAWNAKNPIKSDDKSENRTIPDASPATEADSARDTAPFGGNGGATGTVSKKDNLTIPDDNARIDGAEKTVTVPTQDGGTSNVATVNGGAGEPRRGRGRPSAAEMARRRAAEQSSESQPEPTEQEARQEAESMIAQADQFAF